MVQTELSTLLVSAVQSVLQKYVQEDAIATKTLVSTLFGFHDFSDDVLSVIISFCNPQNAIVLSQSSKRLNGSFV